MCFSLSASIHWFAQSYCEATKCNNNNAEITHFIPVLAGRNLYMSQTPSHQRWDAWPKNCSPKDTHTSVFSILPALHTKDTFTLVLNFEVSHFICPFLLLSFFLPFGVAMKGIQFTQLRCHISFLSFIQLTTCFLSSRGRLLDLRKRRLFCLHIQHSNSCLFERRTLFGSSEAAVCEFCLFSFTTISVHSEQEIK